MRINVSSLTRIIVAAAMIADLGIAHSFAQTSMQGTPSVGIDGTRSAQRPARHRRVRPTANAAARNEGPGSSADGGPTTDLGGANSGLPRSPTAPSANGTGSTGGH